MHMEVHLHADIPMLEGVSKKQIEQAIAPLLEYLDADGLADVKSLEQDEPGLRFDANLNLLRRSFELGEIDLLELSIGRERFLRIQRPFLQYDPTSIQGVQRVALWHLQPHLFEPPTRLGLHLSQI